MLMELFSSVLCDNLLEIRSVSIVAASGCLFVLLIIASRSSA